MKTINKFVVAVLCLTILFVLAYSATRPDIAEAVTTVTNDASITINITHTGNYTPTGSSRISDMSNSIYVGAGLSPILGTTIDLFKNGSAIIDNPVGTDDVPGIHIVRYPGYVQIGAYGHNNDASRETMKADFSFSGATITKTQNINYEDPTTGGCGVNESATKSSNPGNDEITLNGDMKGGTLCSTTSNNSDVVKIYYTVTTSQIVCSTNTQCGINGYTGSAFCSGNSVYQKYRTWTCNNPGTSSSSCSSSDEDQKKNDCATSQICQNAQCINIVCTTNAQCGTNGYIDSPFCKSNSVYQNYKTFTCNNPGTATAHCSNTITETKKTDCITNQICSGGTCTDQHIPCSTNSQCGASGYTGSPFCQGNSVYKNYKTYTCNNPGTVNSYCSDSTVAQKQNDCTTNQTCQNGSCTNNQNDLTVSCYATPNPVNTNQSTTFISNASGGNGSYTYSWSGACSGSSQSCSKTFSGIGTQTATVTVNSGNQSQNANCSVDVTQTYVPVGNLTLAKSVRNISNNSSGFSNSTYANPNDMVMFMLTLQASNADVQNVFVRDTLPYNLVYKNQLVVACTTNNTNNNCNNNYSYNNSGDITSGINIGTIYAGQTVTLTFQAQVATPENFNFGTTTLTNTASATASTGYIPNASSSVIVNRGAVLGASTISTGLTNNFLVDSFILPLILTLLGIGMWKSGAFFGIERWLDNKKKIRNSYKAEKELLSRISNIQKIERI